MRCIHCGAEGPVGPFCSTCGHRQVDAQAHARRTDRFAANPDEHVRTPAFMSTLFPHLDRRGLHSFSWLLAGGAALILVMALTGSVAGAVLAAAMLLPALFLVYLYETRAYGDSPLLVVGVTFTGSVLLGALGGFLARQVDAGLPPVIATVIGPVVLWGRLLVSAGLVVAAQEIVKPAAAMVLRGRPTFRQPMDGFVLGVTAGLGFALGAAIVRFVDVAPTITGSSAAAWIPTLVTDGLLRPASHAAAAAIITLALWGHARRHPWQTLVAVGAAIGGRILFEAGTQLAAGLTDGPIVELAWQALVVGALLVLARDRLHEALLADRTESPAGTKPGAIGTCPNCGMPVDGRSFCPSCGIAQAALPGATSTRIRSGA